MIILTYSYKVKIEGVKYDSYDLLKKTNSPEYQWYMLNKDNELTQTIISEEDSFYKIKIHLGENNNYYSNSYCILHANVFMTLKDENGNLIEEYAQENLLFDENADIEFEFPEIKESKGKKYYLTIKGYSIGKLAMVLGKDNIKDENTLYINGTESDLKIPLETCYKKDDSNYSYFLLLINIIIIGLTIIFMSDKETKLEKTYLIIAIIMGFVTIIFTRLYGGSDELAHLGRIYDISQGNIITKTINDWPNAVVPTKIKNIEFWNYDDITEKINIEDNNEKSLLNMEYAGVYSPISYIPQVIGILFARVFISNTFFWPYVVRIFQAISCIVLIYYAIKIAPFGKKMIFFLALLPSTIKQISLISADSILIAGTMLFVTKILQIIYEKGTITKKDYIILFCLSLIISLSKLVYFPLVLLLLLIPLKIKGKNKSILYNTIFIITFVFTITFVWNVIGAQSLANGQGINTVWYIKYFINRPIELVQKIVYTLYEEIGRFISDIFGGVNLWYGGKIDDGTLMPTVLFVVYIILIAKEKNPLDKKDKILIVAILILIYILISISLLVAYSPVTSGEIMGIQGRYFIIFLLLIYLIFSKGKEDTTNLDLPTIMILDYIIYFLKTVFYLI